MIKYKKFFVVSLLFLMFNYLLIFGSDFQFDECKKKDGECEIWQKVGEEIDCCCDSTYGCSINKKETRVCYIPITSTYNIIPVFRPYSLPGIITTNTLEGSFSSKYGGCKISISGKPKKIHMEL